MRILFLTERYPPHFTGGYEIACACVAGGLRRRQHEVAILTSDFGLDRPEVDGGTTFRLLHYFQGSSSLLRMSLREIADHKTARRVMTKVKPDVIYVWSLFHLFPSLYRALRDSGLPVLLNIQDSWLPQHLSEAERQRKVWVRPGTGVMKRLGKAILRRAVQSLIPGWRQPITAEDLPLENVVFCSRFRLTEHDQLGLPSGRTRVIYNGIDTSIFTGVPGRKSGGPLKVLFVGRLVEEKGAHTAVEAIRTLRCRGCQEIRLSIVGVPTYPLEYSRKLQRSIEVDQLGDLVRFLGMVPHDALPGVYAQHDVLVFPSTINEGLPMTLIEAMACGLAVVGTTTGGSGEILKEGVTGLTFSPGDSNKLADCLQRLLNNQTLHRNLAIAGQRMAREQFNIETAVEQTESFLHEVVENHACHAELRT
jgi:glycosyltransferase involved in cell wall biosynthesis